ncbi:MAG: hypothetical protein GX937_02530 [Lentisphaerae bacterium]|nr:hypothetical protein [Lentisphaerota bacterium]
MHSACLGYATQPPFTRRHKRSFALRQWTLWTSFTQFYPEISANAVLTLLAVACALLDRQVARLAADFETAGGFTERLYRVRTTNRKNEP